MEKKFDLIHALLLGVVLFLLLKSCESDNNSKIPIHPDIPKIDNNIELFVKKKEKVNYKKYKPKQLDSVITRFHPDLSVSTPDSSIKNDSIYCLPIGTAQVLIENDVKSFFKDSIITQIEQKNELLTKTVKKEKRKNKGLKIGLAAALVVGFVLGRK